MALEQFDHEDLLIIEWIEKKIDRSIAITIKNNQDWTEIRGFLHEHEKLNKSQCCHLGDDNERCPNGPEYISYSACSDGCVVWCEKHRPPDTSRLPRFPK